MWKIRRNLTSKCKSTKANLDFSSGDVTFEVVVVRNFVVFNDVIDVPVITVIRRIATRRIRACSYIISDIIVAMPRTLGERHTADEDHFKKKFYQRNVDRPCASETDILKFGNLLQKKKLGKLLRKNYFCLKGNLSSFPFITRANRRTMLEHVIVLLNILP